MRILAVLLVLAAQAAEAHRLVLYAYAEDGAVVVETKFDNGNPAQTGEIRLKDAAEAVLVTTPLEPDGETRLPLPEGAEGGLIVEVETGHGHTSEWILTPSDLGFDP